MGLEKKKPLGNDLLSREAALQVPSALTSLTSGFGMGPGVPPSLRSPTKLFQQSERVMELRAAEAVGCGVGRKGSDVKGGVGALTTEWNALKYKEISRIKACSLT